MSANAVQMMYLALTYDHRLLDGREAVTFLVKIKVRSDCLVFDHVQQADVHFRNT